jgi:hypothetical protein
VVPGVEVEKDPEPEPVIVLTIYCVLDELEPSAPIVTATTAPEFSQVPDAGEGVPWLFIVKVMVYCAVQLSVSVMGAFMVTENCVWPDVEPEKLPAPLPVTLASMWRVVEEFEPSLPIVTATTVPEFSHVPDVGDGEP